MENKEENSGVENKKIPVDERYLQGIDAWNNKDYERAFKIWCECAEENHCYSLYGLGMCYEFGRYVPKDIQSALAHYQLAFDNGYKSAAEKIETLTGKKIQDSKPAVKKPKSKRMGRLTFFGWSLLFLIGSFLFSFAAAIVLSSAISELFKFEPYIYCDEKNYGFYHPGRDGRIIPYFIFMSSCVVYLVVIPFITVVMLYIKASIKRLHDMNLSGWYCLFYIPQTLFLFVVSYLVYLHCLSFWGESACITFLIPLYGWFLFPVFNIALCCFEGTKGANKYGEEPA